MISYYPIVMLKPLALSLVVTMIGLVPATTLGGERHYRGRTLSDWVDQIEVGMPMLDGQEPSSFRAIRHFGTNEIPTLIGWIKSDSVQKREQFAADQLKALSEGKHPVMLGTKACGSAERAQLVFGILGSLARPAIPALRQIALESHDRVQYQTAIHSLISIGEDSYPSIIVILENGRPEVKPFAISDLEYITDWRSNALTLVPPAVNCLTGKDGHTGDMAADVLSRINIPTSSLRPLLTKALPEASAEARLRIYRCLFWSTSFRDEKREETINLLQVALKDYNPEVRNFATNALNDLIQEDKVRLHHSR